MSFLRPFPKKVKKVKDKPILAFWKDFEARADLFVDILANEEEDSEDFIWLEGMMLVALKRCAPSAEAEFGFYFERQRDPMLLVFDSRGDAYLRAVGERLAALYPAALCERIRFAVSEN